MPYDLSIYAATPAEVTTTAARITLKVKSIILFSVLVYLED